MPNECASATYCDRLRIAVGAWCVEAMVAETEEVTEHGLADMRAMMHLADHGLALRKRVEHDNARGLREEMPPWA